MNVMEGLGLWVGGFRCSVLSLLEKWQGGDMNALQKMDRYQREVIQVSTYTEWNRGSVSLQYY